MKRVPSSGRQQRRIAAIAPRTGTHKITQDFAPPLAVLLLALDLLLALLLAPPLALLLFLTLALARLARVILVPVRVLGNQLRICHPISSDASVRRRQVDPVKQVECCTRARERSVGGSTDSGRSRARTDILNLLEVIVVAL